MPESTPAPKYGQRKILPSVEDLDAHLKLDPETGILYRRKQTRGAKAGDVAGALDTKGYTVITIMGSVYYAHRVVFKMFFRKEPPEYLDHENGNRNDNRPANLREATCRQNFTNSRTPITNTSGVKGVSYGKRHKKWRASLRINGKRSYLGYFKTIEEAAAVVRAARELAHGEFCNHG